LEFFGLAAFVFFAATLGAGATGFLEATFFNGVGLAAFGLVVALAACLGVALIGLDFDAGLAVDFAADFLADFLEGISGFAAGERDI
jgi:hypothetical protein